MSECNKLPTIHQTSRRNARDAREWERSLSFFHLGQTASIRCYLAVKAFPSQSELLLERVKLLLPDRYSDGDSAGLDRGCVMADPARAPPRPSRRLADLPRGRRRRDWTLTFPFAKKT